MPARRASSTVVTVVLLVLAGCAAPPAAPPTAPTAPAGTATPTAVPTAPATPTPASSPTPAPTPVPTPTATVAAGHTDAELASAGVNELGRVLVVEWHIIGDTDGEYRTSRATFRAQLEELHRRGYRPVTEAAFLDGSFPIPFGTSPVLLTFDDSTRGQHHLGDDGEPAPDTAVGMLEAFAAEHPEWRATGVFAFNFPEPFGDAGFVDDLRWLVDHGYELSNHTVGHANLASLSSAEVVENLAANLAALREAVPGATPRSLTLPFGAWPHDHAVAAAGTAADGTTYAHELVYLVGSDPTRSPHHVAFDPMAVQRVPAHAVVGTDASWFGAWLDRLEDESLRFVSDGLPDVVTYPADLAEVAAVATTRTTRTYGTP